jgi:hypothetical protein
MNEMRKWTPPVMPGDAINLTSADLEGLDKPNEEFRQLVEEQRREIEEGRATVNAMSPMPDWHRKGITACQVLFARLLAGLIPPDEIEATKRVIVNLIAVGGWRGHLHDLKLIRLAVRGCGFVPGRPLKFKHNDARERNDARASS